MFIVYIIKKKKSMFNAIYQNDLVIQHIMTTL